MCDALVAVEEATADGTTLFAKNSDRKASECQPFVQFPAAVYSPNSRLPCTHIEIPQVSETYRVMGHSPWWVWGFEHGVNEHAVAIGNLTVFSKEPLEEAPGLIGMDLVRLGLERGRTAREALEIIAALIETNGQGGAAQAPDGAGYSNGFLLADPNEAWILETSNRRWAARRARLDSCSNHLSLGRNWEIGSRDLETFARAQGWWTREGRIDVAAAYRDLQVPARISEGRLRRSRELLAARAGGVDVAGLEAILRDHLQGGPVWMGDSTPDDERHFTLCAHSEPIHWTTASVVAPLPADRNAPWPVWISFGTPCTGTFLPVYLDGVIPAVLAAGDAEPDPHSAWWVFKRLQDAASADPLRHTPALRKGWADLEGRIESERREVERRARATSDPDRAEAILTDFVARTAGQALERAEVLREQIS